MTIKEAKTLLGGKLDEVSDEQLQKEIDLAELFKELLFNKLKRTKNPGYTDPNMP